MHKSYFHGTASDYIQVVSHKDQHQKLKGLGFVDSVDDLPGGSGNQVQTEPAQSSQIDIRQAIEECEDKGELESLILSVMDVNLDKRKSLENMKADALQVLDER